MDATATLLNRYQEAQDFAVTPDHVLNPGMDAYERGQRLRKAVVTVNPRICIERARIITQSYRENEGEHVLVQRSKAFDSIMRGIRVYILDDELVVGHQASTQRSAPLFPEFAVEWIRDEIDLFGSRLDLCEGGL